MYNFNYCAGELFVSIFLHTKLELLTQFHVEKNISIYGE